MAARPYEMHALVIVRQAEQRGLAEAWPPLDEQAAQLSYTPKEIDGALDLLVTPAGMTLGGMVDVSDFDGRHVGEFVLADMIEMGDDGHWMLKVEWPAMSELPCVYVEQGRCWQPLRNRVRGERVMRSPKARRPSSFAEIDESALAWMLGRSWSSCTRFEFTATSEDSPLITLFTIGVETVIMGLILVNQ